MAKKEDHIIPLIMYLDGEVLRVVVLKPVMSSPIVQFHKTVSPFEYQSFWRDP